MKIIKIISVNVLLLLCLIEAGSFIYYQAGVSFSKYRPSYITGAVDKEPMWMTEHQNWGAWHKPNGAANIERRCFDADLISNSYGARDKERLKNSSSERIVVLGDSFVEGYGVFAEHRFTNRLEEKQNIEFLNFGVSGDFGPTQYAILYDQMAKEFSHNQVLIGLLPDNDFRDNDPAFWEKREASIFRTRYRPYWKKAENGEGFETFYPTDKPINEVFFADYREASSERSLKSKIQRYFWAYGLYREIRYLTRHSSMKYNAYSGYFDAKPEQIEAVKYYLKEIKQLANGRPVTFFTIPRLSDMKRLKTQKSPLIEEFSSFAKANQMTYFDLTEAMSAKVTVLEDLFLSCDGHWTPLGHQIAAEVIEEKLVTN